jgi:putative ABC transport system permease protein
LLQASVPGIRSTLGVVHISPEVQFQAVLHESANDQRKQAAPLRGFTPSAFLVHPRLRLIQGKLPEAGRDQIMVGALAHIPLGVPSQRLAIGRQLWFENRPWTITAIFESGGTVMESEVWMPLTDLQIAAKRDTISCVVATLGDADFSDVDLFARQRLDLELVAMSEADYYRKQSQFFKPIQLMVIVTAALVALGGLLGGLNTMYAAFAARVRELGALQTLGYPRRAIVLSLIQESILATGVGALIACAIGMLLLDGLSVRFSMGAFGIRIDSAVIAVGLLAGLLLGIIGALPPAFACLRLPIPQALKTS